MTLEIFGFEKCLSEVNGDTWRSSGVKFDISLLEKLRYR